MAGILDSKTRIIDTVITQEGKRQIANGGLRAVYAAVSDKSSYYEYSAVSGSEDASKRIYFESPTEDINDSIVMETDDSGKLLGYPVQGPEFYATDGVITGRASISGSLIYATPEAGTAQYGITGSADAAFATSANAICSSSIDRFKNLYTIGTREAEEPLDLNMEISPRGYKFTINNMFPFNEGVEAATTNLDYIEPLFFDEMLANVINFQYLPPLTKALAGNQRKSPSSPPRVKKFGNYTKFHRPVGLTLEKIMNHMNRFVDLSISTRRGHQPSPPPMMDPDAAEDRVSDENKKFYDSKKPKGDYGLRESEKDGSRVNLSVDQLPVERVSVFFNSTSTTNNLVMQMFELDRSASRLNKLDVINFGTIEDPSSSTHPRKNIFFVGKVFINTIGLPCFVNLFTIIMD
mgnify:CR=1 FL=1